MYTTGYGAPVDEAGESLVVEAESEVDSDAEADADAEPVEEGDKDEEAANKCKWRPRVERIWVQGM